MLSPEEQQQAQKLVESIVSLLNLKLRASIRLDGDLLDVNLTGNDRAYLLTDSGETLLAFQYIFSRMIRRNLPEQSRVFVRVDSDGFMVRHEQELKRLAFRAIDQVRRERRQMKLPPLNPHDRRIVHLLIAENQDLDSSSQGEGFFKNIVIRQKR